MLAAHSWIEAERDYFGRPDTDYDFESRDVAGAKRELRALEKEQETLSKKINKKVGCWLSYEGVA